MKKIKNIIKLTLIIFFSLNTSVQASGENYCWTSPTLIITAEFGMAKFTSNNAGATGILKYKSNPSLFDGYCDISTTKHFRFMTHYIDFGAGIIPSTINIGWYKLSDDVDIKISTTDTGDKKHYLPVVAVHNLIGNTRPNVPCVRCTVSGFSVASSGQIEMKLRRNVLGGAIIFPANFELFTAYRVAALAPPPIKPSVPIMKLLTSMSGSVIPIPAECSLNNGNSINVDFGDIRIDKIKTTPLFNPEAVNVNISIHCKTSVTQDVVIRLVAMTPAFSNWLMVTSNSNLGIAMYHNGKLVQPHGTFPIRLKNGSGQEQISFFPVKNHTKEPKEGAFTASGILIVEAL